MLTLLITPAREHMNTMLAEFTRSHPRIVVAQETAPGRGPLLMERLRTQMVTGDPPDMFWLASGEIARPFIDAGFVAPLDAYYKKYDWEKVLIPWAARGIRYKDQWWGVPRSTRGMGFWYRADTFRRWQLTPPSSYEQLEDICRTLHDHHVYCLSMGGKFGWNTMRLLDYLVELSAGPELHDRLNRLEASWNCPEVARAYALLKRWVDEEWILPGFLSLAPDDARLPWYRGDAAMVFEGDWMEAAIRTDEQDIANFDFFLAPTDHVPIRFSAFPEQIMVASASPHKDAAAAFLNWYIQPDVQRRYFTLLEGPTAAKGVLPDPAQWPRLYRWRQVLGQDNVYWPTDQVFVNQLMDSWFQVQDSVVAGRLSPEEAARQLQDNAAAWKSRGRS
jgi:raffinose/stachyose/melibiose transport system substrate-binding protein